MSSHPTFIELDPALRVAAVEEIRRPLWAGMVEAGHMAEHPLSDESVAWLKRMRRAAVEDNYQDEFTRLDQRFLHYLDTLDEDERDTLQSMWWLYSAVLKRMPVDCTSAKAFLDSIDEYGWELK